MPSSYFVPILIAGMIITGSSNSLWSKWQDMQCVEDCDDPDSSNHVLYEQPVWQTLQMFLGECLCFLPVLYTLATRQRSIQLPATEAEAPVVAPTKSETEPKPLTGWRILLLWLPTLCDLTGTTLMNVGLLFTPVSIYQMTRGALVLFVGTLSVVFLRRRLYVYQWLALCVVMTGVCLVGLSGSMIKEALVDPLPSTLKPANLEEIPTEKPEPTTVLVGVFFVLFAQIFTATQFVVEEKIMERYSVEPLVAVGFEGLFGVITILLLFPVLAQFADKSTYFDLPRGWHQMINTPAVLWTGIVVAISISLFNYFGLSVTRHVSATVRSLTDTCRTLLIWIISLGLGWERILFPMSLLQFLGFFGLVYGTFLFNDLVPVPKIFRPKVPDHGYQQIPGDEALEEEERRIVAEHHLEETATLPAGGLGTASYDAVGEPQQRSTHAHSS
ncbi:hypothetical protein SISSUDRAFT_1013225 [Sistotremastrum suecicum HHB10207 ss-3]|uniref:Integral membrane protein n=1 Tax=Sistotremastrum suecicum HHB10207 ss-3 TaxID=1314776 RepID=A0A166IWK3_9AGAM|nr:hypothetical protein SISSUDRAFT_1013225 [Sistotremastrum suecicum HHB10207 ss-3]